MAVAFHYFSFTRLRAIKMGVHVRDSELKHTEACGYASTDADFVGTIAECHLRCG